jgi:ABC-type uncharacterized transport system involved in gliding motility auxiliary subunit
MLNAYRTYTVTAIVAKYLAWIEEIINIVKLRSLFNQTIGLGYLNNILDEIVIQSKIEFHYEEVDIEDIEEEGDSKVTEANLFE